MHDIKFDLNCIHRRFLLDLTKSELDHGSERIIGGSINGAGIFSGDHPLLNPLDKSLFGIICFKVLVNPSCVE
jgi:hypothetical protein